MRVNREELLTALTAVAPGLAAREFIEQSTCVIFTDGKVCTYNDENACAYPCDVGVTGAVSAAPLQAILGKLAEDEVDITAAEGQLIVAGKKRRAGVRMESEITLAYANVDQPKKWKPLHADFADAVGLIHQCAAKRDSSFSLTCVHIAADYIEACDNMQAARWPLETGIKTDTLIKRETIKHIIHLDMTEFSETESWLHFRNAAGLVLSCRRYADDYPDLTPVLEHLDGQPFTFPGGLAEVLDKAEVFSAEADANNRVAISLKQGRLKVRGEGVHGWYEEVKQIAYDGDPLRFNIGPDYLKELAKMNNECEITEGKLVLNTGKFLYITCTGDMAEPAAAAEDDVQPTPPKPKRKKAAEEEAPFDEE